MATIPEAPRHYYIFQRLIADEAIEVPSGSGNLKEPIDLHVLEGELLMMLTGSRTLDQVSENPLLDFSLQEKKELRYYMAKIRHAISTKAAIYIQEGSGEVHAWDCAKTLAITRIGKALSAAAFKVVDSHSEWFFELIIAQIEKRQVNKI